MKLSKIEKLLMLMIASVAICVPAKAQTYGAVTIPTNICGPTITGSATSNMLYLLDCQYNRNVTIFSYAASSNNVASSATIHWRFTPNGSTNFMTTTNAGALVNGIGAGTNTVCCVSTNIDVGAAGWLVIYDEVAGSGTLYTNSIIVTQKPPPN